MGGAHRRDGPQGGGAGRSARLLLGAAAIAAVALSGYLLVHATSAEDDALALAIGSALLVWTLARRPVDWTSLCVACGIAFTASWDLISLVAHRDHWPASDLWVIAVAGDCLQVAAVAGVAVSVAAGLRSGRLDWPPWRRAPRPGQED